MTREFYDSQSEIQIQDGSVGLDKERPVAKSLLIYNWSRTAIAILILIGISIQFIPWLKNEGKTFYN